MTQETLKQFAKDLKKNIPGYIAVAITEIGTGISFYFDTRRPTFNPEIASSFNLEVVKAKMKAIEALGLNQTIENIIINLSSQIHIIEVSENKDYFIYLALDAKKANLAQAKNNLIKIRTKNI